jgi:6-phosphogluconolactonase
MKVVVETGATQAATRAAALMAVAVVDAVVSRGRASVAFSGGSTPDAMFGALAKLEIPWSAVDVFQVDERIVPADDTARNWRSLLHRLLDPMDVPEERRHPMPVDHEPLSAAADDYAAELMTAAPDGLDVVHLGLGTDGHTASWPPGDPVVRADKDVAVVGPYRGVHRMTLTPRAVNRAGVRLWLVTGDDKAAPVRGLLARDPDLPAAAVTGGPSDVLVADEAAARQIPGA